MATATTQSIEINGKKFTAEDLDFGEQLALRDLCRHVSGDPEAHPTEVRLNEFLPCLVAVVTGRERCDDDTTGEQRRQIYAEELNAAMRLRFDDVVKDDKPKPRPHKAAASKSA